MPRKSKSRIQALLLPVLLVAALTVTCSGCVGPRQHSAYRSIHADARSGNAALVAADLAQNPAGLNLPDDAGFTPLHLAAASCHTNVVALLLQKGAKIDVRSKDGSTPLHLAAQEGCIKVVALLLSHGASINARDDHGRTPLRRAELWHQDDVVDFLRNHGGSE